jgi:hypothetical protein
VALNVNVYNSFVVDFVYLLDSHRIALPFSDDGHALSSSPPLPFLSPGGGVSGEFNSPPL